MTTIASCLKIFVYNYWYFSHMTSWGHFSRVVHYTWCDKTNQFLRKNGVFPDCLAVVPGAFLLSLSEISFKVRVEPKKQNNPWWLIWLLADSHSCLWVFMFLSKYSPTVPAVVQLEKNEKEQGSPSKVKVGPFSKCTAFTWKVNLFHFQFASHVS